MVSCGEKRIMSEVNSLFAKYSYEHTILALRMFFFVSYNKTVNRFTYVSEQRNYTESNCLI